MDLAEISDRSNRGTLDSRVAARRPVAGLTARVGSFLCLAVAAMAAALAVAQSGRQVELLIVLWLVAAGALGVAVHRLVMAVGNLALEYRSIIHSAHDSFISIDEGGRIVEWNRRAEHDFGWTRDEVIGRRFEEVVVPPAERVGGGITGIVGANARWGAGRAEAHALHRDGHRFPVEMTVSTMELEHGHRFNFFLHDITERRDAERALREAQERFRRAFDDAAIGMALTSPDGRWLQVNQSLADLTGYGKDELVGMSFADITHPEDLSEDLEALRGLVSGGRQRFITEKRYIRADGQIVWVSLSVSSVRGEEGEVLYLISQMQDITERKRAEAKLAHQAMHDPLTGLPHRVLFADRLRLARARIARGGSLALLFCDLDYFKDVNDGLGHEAGDRLLVEAAGRLRSALRPSDTVARLGGDEFAILCEGADLAAAELIACRIAEVFAPPFLIGEREVLITVSTGVVLAPTADEDPDRLVRDADLAMYAAKQGGRARHVVFHPGLRSGRFRQPNGSEPLAPRDVEPEPLSL